MDYKDYYKTLGVSKGADDKTIKAAYRRLARKYHPDVNKGSGERFKEINEAYAVLSDPDKRKRYDALGPDWERYARAGAGAGAPFGSQRVRFETGGEGGFSDFFRTIFGDLIGGARGRSDFGTFDFGNLGGEWTKDGTETHTGGGVEIEVELTLEDAFRGVRKTVTVEIDEPCPDCGGAGEVNRRPCARCRGTGVSKNRRHLDVKIPAGVDTGSRVRVALDSRGGDHRGGRGDLFLNVTVKPDSRFERKGSDLHLDLPVDVTDAALGAEVSVPTLRGQVSMKIPPETSSGRTFRLPGYGMPRIRDGGAGDQYVRVLVKIPAGLSEGEKDLFRQLRRSRGEAKS